MAKDFSKMDDFDLFQYVRLKDEDAFSVLYKRYYPDAVNTAYKYVGDKGAAKDIAQNLFQKIYFKAGNYDVKTSVKSYVRKAVVHESLNYIQKKKKFLFNEPDIWLDESAEDDSAGDFYSDASLHEVLHLEINRLPPKCQIVFRLVKFEEMSHREIATQLGISESTVENHITRAMKLLQAALKKHGFLALTFLSQIFFNLFF